MPFVQALRENRRPAERGPRQVPRGKKTPAPRAEDVCRSIQKPFLGRFAARGKTQYAPPRFSASFDGRPFSRIYRATGRGWVPHRLGPRNFLEKEEGAVWRRPNSRHGTNLRRAGGGGDHSSPNLPELQTRPGAASPLGLVIHAPPVAPGKGGGPGPCRMAGFQKPPPRAMGTVRFVGDFRELGGRRPSLCGVDRIGPAKTVFSRGHKPFSGFPLPFFSRQKGAGGTAGEFPRKKNWWKKSIGPFPSSD